MTLDPCYDARFGPIRNLTWDDVAGGDPDVMERLAAYQRPPAYTPPPVDIGDDSVPGPHGPVPVRIYTAVHPVPGDACLVWMHGGAFQFGNLEMLEAHAVAAELAHRWRAAVVSVDYRLAPAVRYPVPLDDCVAVAAWAAERHRAVAVGGASAGGNLAAATALRARDEGGPLLHAVCLAYPVTHHQPPAPSAEAAARAAELPPLARFPVDSQAELFRAYLGRAVSDPPPHAAPALADLAGFPPTAIAIAEHDDLRPAGEAFAGLLDAHGVTTEAWVEPGTAHGYLNELAPAGTGRTLNRFVRFLGHHASSG